MNRVKKKEREHHQSKLKLVSNVSFLESGGSTSDLLVVHKLRKFIIEEYRRADANIKNMENMDLEKLSEEYTHHVL